MPESATIPASARDTVASYGWSFSSGGPAASAGLVDSSSAATDAANARVRKMDDPLDLKRTGEINT